MKRILVGILAGGLSLAALTVGSNAASAAEPCAPAVVRTVHVQPAGYGYGYYGNGYERAREIRLRERLRWEQRQREEARRRWFFEHRYGRY